MKTTSKGLLFRRRKGLRPKAIVVARARVGRRISFQPGDSGTLEVMAGQPFTLKFAYSFEEVSRNRETFRFELRSRAEANQAPPETVEHVDRWLLPDAGGGLVEQRYVLDRPGEYELDYEVGVSYTSQDWSKRKVLRRASDSRSGSIRVIVRKPAS